MISFPNKFNPIPSSVIGHMLEAIEEIPTNGIELTVLRRRLSPKMDISDMIDSLTCLYAVNAIVKKDTKIYRK